MYRHCWKQLLQCFKDTLTFFAFGKYITPSPLQQKIKKFICCGKADGRDDDDDYEGDDVVSFSSKLLAHNWRHSSWGSNGLFLLNSNYH